MKRSTESPEAVLLEKQLGEVRGAGVILCFKLGRWKVAEWFQ